MTIDLPALDFQQTIQAIHANRDKIREARAAYKGALKALDGLQKANEGMCDHRKKEKRFDPGYAGGGFSHYECPDCGGHIQ